MPLSMMRAGAVAWMTPSQPLNAYLGRRMTITRNFAGVTSSRSETYDQDLFQSFAASRRFGLDNHLDPFKMGRKAFARARRALRFRTARSLFHLRFDGCHAGFDFVEDESVLLRAQRAGPQPFERLPKRDRSSIFTTGVSRAIRSSALLLTISRCVLWARDRRYALPDRRLFRPWQQPSP